MADKTARSIEPPFSSSKQQNSDHEGSSRLWDPTPDHFPTRAINCCYSFFNSELCANLGLLAAGIAIVAIFCLVITLCVYVTISTSDPNFRIYSASVSSNFTENWYISLGAKNAETGNKIYYGIVEVSVFYRDMLLTGNLLNPSHQDPGTSTMFNVSFPPLPAHFAESVLEQFRSLKPFSINVEIRGAWIDDDTRFAYQQFSFKYKCKDVKLQFTSPEKAEMVSKKANKLFVTLVGKLVENLF